MVRSDPRLLQEHGAAEYKMSHMQGHAPSPLALEQAHHHPLESRLHSWDSQLVGGRVFYLLHRKIEKNLVFLHIIVVYCFLPQHPPKYIAMISYFAI